MQGAARVINHEQMLALLNALPDPVFVLTETGEYAGVFGHVDPAYYHDGQHLQGQRVQDLFPADTAEWIMEQIRKTLQENRLIKVEYQLSAAQVKGLEGKPGPDGMIWFEAHIQPFPQPIAGKRAVIWVARNISRRKRLEQALLEASQTDSLTCTANRRRLLKMLQEHFVNFVRYHHPMAMIMFDIDHFKRINDTHGHLVGDEILKCLCQLCRESLRENDLLARFGGEEFIIVLPNTTAAQAMVTAERIRQRIPEAIVRQLGKNLQVTISLGVSELYESDTDPEQIIQRVDDAIYQAKEGGRNRTVHYPG